MDKSRAKRITNELRGHQVGNWTIVDYINHGKSAVVLRATRNREEAALKVFDLDLVERFGQDSQLMRIEREKELIGKTHSNLIEIKDGGICPKTGYMFVAMAYVPYKNLAQVLLQVPRDCIFPIIGQIALAAKFLEELELVHRDIKPANIAVSGDFRCAILLDLGVVRPLRFSDLTDQDDKKTFIGTLQYSPTELVYREEEDSLEGWRAVTFYQLGAVLHDLIMQRPIFEEYCHPYAKLIDAIKETNPSIMAPDIDSDLILLANSCLVKDPKVRNSLIQWEHFFQLPKKPSNESIRDRIMRRRAISSSSPVDNAELERQKQLHGQDVKLDKIANSLLRIIHDICVSDKECFPPIGMNLEVEQDGLVASITLCIEPSHRHNISATLKLRLKVTLTHEFDDLVAIEYTALACYNGRKPDLKSYEGRQCFAGPYKEEVIRDRVAGWLLSLVDKGQEVIPSPQSNPQKANEVIPINLNLDGETRGPSE